MLFSGILHLWGQNFVHYWIILFPCTTFAAHVHQKRHIRARTWSIAQEQRKLQPGVAPAPPSRLGHLSWVTRHWMQAIHDQTAHGATPEKVANPLCPPNELERPGSIPQCKWNKFQRQLKPRNLVVSASFHSHGPTFPGLATPLPAHALTWKCALTRSRSLKAAPTPITIAPRASPKPLVLTTGCQ